ncbi:DUF417 family protein [Antrihabitans sp. YC3-6]|uniref:DUF417 family protein n=1 Tax=Antrihabitans stalagmiti TaxID=2799499 RepID=A0A934NM14_9NOCA|nr:DUF417 family protein [Antrihabitans stalagmiti]MBJ8337703.1 DUF417 family protein [Antrihabitans stalagmiti]
MTIDNAPSTPKVLENTDLARKVETAGNLIARFGLIVTLFWIGAMKFTVAEAMGIEPLVQESPLLAWLLDIVELRTLSNTFGVIEIVTAVLLGLGLVRPIFGVIGGLLAIGTFLITLSFLFTSTTYEHTIPFFSPGGSFIVKDIVLLGVSVAIFAQSWSRLLAARVR